ncbi:TPA: hypothetical protein JS159_004242 [Serratia marcescens]|nr:hypothetical protein [Serratia marcescens]
MISPVEKTNEISRELASFIDDGRLLKPLEFRRYLREIEKIKSGGQYDYLMAMVNGANGSHAAAMEWFERALRHRDPVIAENYLVYLSKNFKYIDYIRESLALTQEFPGNIDICRKALKGMMFSCDINGVKRFSCELSRMLPAREGESVMVQASKVVEQAEKFASNAGMDNEDLTALSNILLHIAEQAKTPYSKLTYFSMAEEGANALIFHVNTDDSDLLSEMNFDLAMALASDDRFIGKKFSSWFRGDAA